MGNLPIHIVSELVAGHGLGTGEEGRCPAVNAGRYDLELEKDRLGDALEGIRPLSAAS